MRPKLLHVPHRDHPASSRGSELRAIGGEQHPEHLGVRPLDGGHGALVFQVPQLASTRHTSRTRTFGRRGTAR